MPTGKIRWPAFTLPEHSFGAAISVKLPGKIIEIAALFQWVCNAISMKCHPRSSLPATHREPFGNSTETTLQPSGILLPKRGKPTVFRKSAARMPAMPRLPIQTGKTQSPYRPDCTWHPAVSLAGYRRFLSPCKSICKNFYTCKRSVQPVSSAAKTMTDGETFCSGIWHKVLTSKKQPKTSIFSPKQTHFRIALPLSSDSVFLPVLHKEHIRKTDICSLKRNMNSL